MYFIAGITGHVGGAAAASLLAQGERVCALVRDTSKASSWLDRGVDLREGDLTDAAAVASALEGVAGAFLMQPTPFGVTRNFPVARAINAGLLEGLQRSPPPKAVVLSSVGSERSSGVGNITQTHLLEQALDGVPFPIAFVRAGALFENHLRAAERAKSSGWFDSFLQPTDQSFPMVATQDIGNEVAQLLLSDWVGKRVIELGDRITPDALARAIGEQIGREVKARALPRDRWTATLQTMGLSADQIGNWEEMQDGFNSRWIDFGRPETEPVPSTLTPGQFFATALESTQ